MAKGAVRYNLVVIGGSAGSLDVVLKIIAEIPDQTSVPFLVVVHRKSDADSVLQSLLKTRTGRPVREVEDKDQLEPGVVYIAPPDYHLLLEDKHNFSLDFSEKVNFSRPSIDVTFRAVADVFGPEAIGVLLSGANADGAAGLKAIKKAGGVSIVQDPETAEVQFMPRQAILVGAHSHVSLAHQIPVLLKQLLTETK